MKESCWSCSRDGRGCRDSMEVGEQGEQFEQENSSGNSMRGDRLRDTAGEETCRSTRRLEVGSWVLLTGRWDTGAGGFEARGHVRGCASSRQQHVQAGGRQLDHVSRGRDLASRPAAGDGVLASCAGCLRAR